MNCEIEKEMNELLGKAVNGVVPISKEAGDHLARISCERGALSVTREYWIYEGRETNYIVALNEDKQVVQVIPPMDDVEISDKPLYVESIESMKENRSTASRVRKVVSTVSLILLACAIVFAIMVWRSYGLFIV